MRLTILKLEDFRGFKTLALELHPQVTVLVGVNGCGKTTILDAIAMQLGWMTGNRTGLSYTKRDVREGADEAVVGIKGTYGKLTIDLKHRFRNENQTTSLAVQSPRFTDKERTDGPLPLIIYYRVTRHADDETPGAKNPREWTASWAWTEGLYQRKTTFGAFFEWFRDREDIENEQIRDDPKHVDVQLEAVRNALARLLPGYTKPRVSRQPVPVLTIRKDDQTLAFNQLSEGERTLAALGCDIARRLALANPGGEPLEGQGIALIDEIDLHLHPEWQRNIIPALRRTFPNLQLVVTTHSPIVLSYIKRECVRVIENFELVEELPPTLGRDPNSLLEEIFGQPLRREDVTRQLHELALLIDEEKLDQARSKLDELRSMLGDDDSEIVRYRSMLDLLSD